MAQDLGTPRDLKVRSRFNYDPDAASEITGLITPEETRTQQQFQEESDINVLVRRFRITGQLPENVRMPTYADFGEIYDFHSAANAIAEANEAFHAMPADIRKRFGNDPAEFVAFCSNENNRKEAEAMGLVPAPIPLNTAPPTPNPGSAGDGVAPSEAGASTGG